MDAGTVIAAVLSLLIVVSALAYIVVSRLRGQRCVGCPYAKECGKDKCSCCVGADCDDEK